MRHLLLAVPVAMLAVVSWAGDLCFDTVTAIPVQSPTGVTTSIDVPCDGDQFIHDLDLEIRIQHTWIGDLEVTLAKQDGPSELVIDRIGAPGIGPFGCAGDDIDAMLNDEAASAVEHECGTGIPSIQGELIPGDPPAPLLSSFDGLEFCGTWELNIADIAGADSGVLQSWCLLPTVGDTPPPPQADVPATNGGGRVVLILVLLGSAAALQFKRMSRPTSRGSRR